MQIRKYVIDRTCSACEKVKNAHSVLIPRFRDCFHLHVFQKQNIILFSKLNLFSSLDVRVEGSRDCNSPFPSDTAEQLGPST